MKKLLLLGMLLLPSIADAADNTVLITPCASGCITMKSRDVGSGVESMQIIPGDLTGAAIGSLAAYGSAPTGNALPTNAFVTNTPTVSLPTWAGGTLGAMANYGTSPGAVLVPGVNAFVTNTNANGQATAANSSPVVLPVLQQTGGATGSAVPANASYGAANVGGNLTGSIKCGSSAIYDASTSGSTQLVALASSQKVYICGYSIFGAGTVNVKLVYGTGSNCATGATAITPAFQLTTQTGVVDGSPEYRGLATIASNALCINASAAVAAQAIVYYTQF